MPEYEKPAAGGTANRLELLNLDDEFNLDEAADQDQRGNLDDDQYHLDTVEHAPSVTGHLEDPLPGETAPDTSKVVLRLGDWIDRDLLQPDFLLGNVFTTTTRAALAAETGLGKTMMVITLGLHMAAGKNFLHWTARRRCRVFISMAK